MNGSIDRLSRLDDDLSKLTVEILREIDDETYKRCSNQNRGSGGRTGIDVTLRRCLKDKLGIKVKESGHTRLQGGIPVKHDGHFVVGGKNIFIEYKGYPEEGHILAIIMAAQLIKEGLGNNIEFYLIVHNHKNLARMRGRTTYRSISPKIHKRHLRLGLSRRLYQGVKVTKHDRV